MHLLATEPGIIADGSAAIDLAQTPGDIIMLTSADTENALIAAAPRRRPASLALSRRRRAGQRRQFPALCIEPNRRAHRLGRARAAAARRALLAGLCHAEPRRHCRGVAR